MHQNIATQLCYCKISFIVLVPGDKTVGEQLVRAFGGREEIQIRICKSGKSIDAVVKVVASEELIFILVLLEFFLPLKVLDFKSTLLHQLFQRINGSAGDDGDRAVSRISATRNQRIPISGCQARVDRKLDILTADVSVRSSNIFRRR